MAWYGLTCPTFGWRVRDSQGDSCEMLSVNCQKHAAQSQSCKLAHSLVLDFSRDHDITQYTSIAHLFSMPMWNANGCTNQCNTSCFQKSPSIVLGTTWESSCCFSTTFIDFKQTHGNNEDGRIYGRIQGVAMRGGADHWAYPGIWERGAQFFHALRQSFPPLFLLLSFPPLPPIFYPSLPSLTHRHFPVLHYLETPLNLAKDL